MLILLAILMEFFMGILSSSISISSYHVDGNKEENIIQKVTDGLEKNSIKEIDKNAIEKTVGWTSYNSPYKPDFKGSSFLLGTYFVFSLRIDKKSIPSKIIKKHFVEKEEQLLKMGNRKYLSRNEKKNLRDQIISSLILRIPATPHIYDLIWNYEESMIFFFSNQKSANEDFETLFSKSFKIKIIRLFPYTSAFLKASLSADDIDKIDNLSPENFSG